MHRIIRILQTLESLATLRPWVFPLVPSGLARSGGREDLRSLVLAATIILPETVRLQRARFRGSRYRQAQIPERPIRDADTFRLTRYALIAIFHRNNVS